MNLKPAWATQQDLVSIKPKTNKQNNFLLLLLFKELPAIYLLFFKMEN
jgi:hypothetical protein